MRTAATATLLLLAGCAAPTADIPPDEPAPAPTLAASAPAPLPALGKNAAEPSIAARAGDPADVLVAAEMTFHDEGPGRTRAFEITIHRSPDAGATWTSEPLPADVRTPFDPSGAMDYVGDPVLAYAPDATLWLGAVAAHGFWQDTGTVPIIQLTGLTAFLTKSTDDGATWSPALFHRVGAGTFGFPVLFAGQLQDKEWVAVAPDGTVHFCWTEFVETQAILRHTRSTDHGATWTEPTPVTISGPGRLVQGCHLAPTPDALHLTATEFAAYGGEGVQLVWTSTDAGTTWNEPVPVAPAASFRFGHLAADPTRPGTLHLLTTGTGPGPAILSTSHDAGTTWNTTELGGTDAAQPRARVDPEGRLHAAYYDDEDITWTIVQDGRPTTIATHPVGASGFYRREYFGLDGIENRTYAAFVTGPEDATVAAWSKLAPE